MEPEPSEIQFKVSAAIAYACAVDGEHLEAMKAKTLRSHKGLRLLRFKGCLMQR